MNEVNSRENIETPSSKPNLPVTEIRKNGNHLVNQASLYLQQHAYNPIDWYPWGDEAQNRAKNEEKPIFLSIGYSSCHWCHVMEHEVFEHDDVAEFMNANFICIKVDREERPDLDTVYMEAVQIMTGRGGWPMSVFLTPDLKPFYGGTYFPKQQFMELTARINEIFRAQRSEIEEQAEKLTSQIQNAVLLGVQDEKMINAELVSSAAGVAHKRYDKTNGGFQQTQKFPTPIKWRFLLHEYRQHGNSQLGEMVEQTCAAMSQGGLYDHLGGGFHRYTVDSDWTVPHFEKMLYDNGQLAGLMLEAGIVFDRQDFVATGLDVLDFLLRDMRSENGGIYASYDADSGGEEGTFYVWDQAGLVAVTGETDGALLAEILGVSRKGNFEHTGKSVLTQRADMEQIAHKNDLSVAYLSDLFAEHRTALLAARNKRVAPGLDRKIVTSWNGLAIASLAQGYAVTGETKYLDGAIKAADFLLDKHRRDDGSLWRASSDGKLTAEGIVDDYAFLADGLLELYQVSGRPRYLAAARELIDFALDHFSRPEGGFFISRAEVEAPLGRRVEFFDSVIPAGNSMMFNNLVRLAAVTGETKYKTRAVDDLNQTADLMERAGLEMAWSLEAVRRLTSPYYDVVIVGDDTQNAPSSQAAKGLAQTLISMMPPNAVISLLPVEGVSEQLLKLAPALDGKVAIKGKPTAYVCEFGTCLAPTHDTREMLEQVSAGWHK